MAELLYKRILLKISGESLQGKQGHGYDPEAVADAAARIRIVLETGVQIALVVGGGNLWRGAAASEMDRVTADHMGMLATVMNALRLKDALTRQGVTARVHASADLRPFAPRFDRDEALTQLSRGEVVIFAGGTGAPFFTTDTTAALRALETNCDAVVKATKVDGIYTADPVKDPSAVKYDRITFAKALGDRLKIMDSAAFSLCMDNGLHIIVCRFTEPDALVKILHGDFSSGTIVS